MAIRAFKATFLCVIDDDNAVVEGIREKADGPVTLEEMKDYLSSSLAIDWVDDSVGIHSVEILFEEMVELSDKERKKLYND